MVLPGDGLDNDCDGLIDEEEVNNVDDDNDILIDEDTKFTRGDDSSGKEFLLMFMENVVEQAHDIDMEVRRVL